MLTYQPPGVYVEDISQDLILPLASGIPENLLCIVAPSRGHQEQVEKIRLYASQPSALSKKDIVQDELVLWTTAAIPVLLTLNTDYDTVVDEAGVTKVTRNPASAKLTTDGQMVQAIYTFADATYFEPKRFSDYPSLALVYGPALTSSGGGSSEQVYSPMSLAAKIAFENGAGEIICLPVDNAASTRLEDYRIAYDKLATDHRISVMVVVTPDEVIHGSDLQSHLTDMRTHCDDASENGYGRTVITGASRDYDEVGSVDHPYVSFDDQALFVANKRIVLVYPNKFNIYNPASKQTLEVGGCYAAAALGGRIVFNTVERSLTRQVLKSFVSLPASVQQKMSRKFKDDLSVAGVCVIETDRLNRLVVRHAVTTDVSSLTHREISLVRISDVLSQNLQVGLDNSGLIGQPIDDEMTMRVKGALLNLLERAVADNVIVGYIQVLVKQQSLPNGDPSVIECQFAYRPAVPLNYILVKFSLNMTTGMSSMDSSNSSSSSSNEGIYYDDSNNHGYDDSGNHNGYDDSPHY